MGIPEWCYRGGYFRPPEHFDKPTEWRKVKTGKRKGKWVRYYVIPYGKANPEYRDKYYRCPECGNPLKPSTTTPYTFTCMGCGKTFKYGWGNLYEV